MPDPIEDLFLREQAWAELKKWAAAIRGLKHGINGHGFNGLLSCLRMAADELMPYHVFDLIGWEELHGGLLGAVRYAAEANGCFQNERYPDALRVLESAYDWAEKHQYDPPALEPDDEEDEDEEEI